MDLENDPPPSANQEPPAPGSWSRVGQQGIGSVIHGAILLLLYLILDLFPRNPDNSMKAEVLMPAAAIVFVTGLWIRRRTSYWPLRHALLWWIWFSGLGAALGILVLLIKAFN